MVNFVGAGIPLTSSGLLAVCNRLSVKAADIWAVVLTETDYPHAGFWADRRPQILYEQHVFHRLTHGRFDATNPDISNPSPGNYGASGDHQYDRLNEALALDESAALQSASWGIGQTLGENYAIAGYASPEEMVSAMCNSEDPQLLAAANEMANSGAADYLRVHDWKGFAAIYNGPTYWKNQYDQHLATAYAKVSGVGLPDLRIRTAQVYLMYLNYHPRDIDGRWGVYTQSAMQAYQRDAHLPITDNLDDATYARLVADGQRPPAPLRAAPLAARKRKRR